MGKILPQKVKIGTVIGFLLLCSSSYFVTSLEQHDESLVKKLPEAPISCYHCREIDDNCDDPDLHECPDENDECFIQFSSEHNDVILMGCRSAFESESEVVDLIKAKQLWFCSGDKCNDYDNYWQNFPTNECVICNSLSGVSCVTNPDIEFHQKCATPPYTQCFERAVVENGGTLRGCLHDLMPDQFYNCLTGEDPYCRICHGEKCNEENIPADRVQCLRCDSTIDSSCHTKPSGLSACPKFDVNDSCVSNYVSGVTKRGCLTEFACDANSRSCAICRGDGCNTQNVRKLTEEIYGIFQTLPLSCNTCTGAECQEASPQKDQCGGESVYQDCMTIFDTDGVVVRRGCEGVIEDNYLTHCEEHPELCFNCKSNNCNTIEDSNVYQECLYCNSAVDANCVFDPTAIKNKRRCTEGCITSLYPREGNEKVLDLVRACLEDIELEERDSCATGNCKTCTAADCNTHILPEETKRLECYHCTEDNCDEPVSKECVGFTEADQCYMQFDNVTYSVVAMGCKSEFTDVEVSAKIKQFYLCDGDNCNDYTNLAPAHLCIECDSAKDVNCAVDATKFTERRCSVNPYTDCYTRVRSDGHTERGCLYSLPTDNFLNCLDSSDPNCRVCSESSCNQVIFPENRPQCYRCNSTYSRDCEATPSTAQACPIYKEDDSCTTKIVNGVTHRGCSSELSCEGSGRKTCRTCNDKNCNTVNLIELDVGDPGKFQTLPLNCYHCEDGADCVGILRKCEGNNKQTCTTAFATNGSVVSRGCSDLLDNICSIDGNNCYDCKSSGCNKAKKESDYVDCLFCDAQESDACVFDVNSVTRSRKCFEGCLTALYPRTTDINPVYELTRTCLDDLDLDDRERCAGGNQADCNVCTGGKCNTLVIGERKSCYQCSGEDCQSPIAKECRGVAEHDQCYVQYDETGHIVELGCKSQYDTPDLDILMRAKRLWLCDEDNCNSFENLPAEHDCSLCNSRTDPLCATTPNSVLGKTRCASMPFTQCYMRVLEGGYTDRGCLSSLEGDQFLNCLNNVNATDCLTCDEENCNQVIHPADRLSCNTCSSDTNSACEERPQSSKVCLKYADQQQCLSELTQDGITKRGCSLEVSCDPNSTYCVACDGENCNTSNFKRRADGKPGQWQELPLTCYSCSNEQECAVASNSQICQGREYCMTVFNENGAVIRRGCSEEVESNAGDYCDLNAENCHNCNSNQCNSATSHDDFIDCVYCDTKTDANCLFNVDAVQTRKCHKGCMTALYPSEQNSGSWELTRTCLDDKDEPDQANCQGGFCKSCAGAACNTDMLPEVRRSCWSCIGAECEDPVTSTCQLYKENDRCFLLFDNFSDIARLGCESDLSDSNLKDFEDLLLFCDEGDNCNFFDKIPPPQRCAECNSINDPRCAASPVGVANHAQCSLPNTQCYTKVNTDGSTSRGCVSSLAKTQKLACLSGNATDCTTCLGDRCNIEIYPADRRICHRCDSIEDPLCASSSVSTSACPFYSANEFCTVKYVNGHTYRGCSSEFQCDDRDKRYCRQCIGTDNCNYVDLASLDIGDPGKWQTLPINCHTCVGEDCKSDSAGPLRKCEGNNLQTCGIAFANDGSIVQRGCSDQLLNGDFVQQCDDGNCKFCKSSGCNNAKSLNDYVDCLNCDSTESSDCVRGVSGVEKTRSCHGKCMTALYPRSRNDTNPVLDLSRSCLNDLDLDDRVDCENGNNDYCKACEGTSCNTDMIPADRLRCNICNDPASCQTTWVQSGSCLGYRENDQCFTLFNEDKIQLMGCASDLESQFIQANRRQIFLCDGDNCNNPNNHPKPVACSYCNSTANSKCLSDPSDLSVVCEYLPYPQCFTRISDAGITFRGCLNDLPDNVFDDCLTGNSNTCEICESNNCNGLIYPPERLSCNICNSEDDADCESSAQQYADICPIFENNDSCVTAFDGTKLTRGCASDFTCDVTDRYKCRYCQVDNCNTIDLFSSYIGEPGKWQGLPLSCYHCEGDDCSNDNPELKSCEGNNKQTCTTVFADDGSVTSRGCSDTVNTNHGEFCEENPDKCLGCKSNGCNNVANLNLYNDCYFCDSSNSKSCSVNFGLSTRTRKCHSGCMVALYPRTSSSDPAYEMSRSCLDDLEEEDRDECKAGNKEHCIACDGGRCNTVDLPEVEERHECYSCVDSDCEDAEVRKCNAYHPNDQCYTLFDYEGSVAGLGCRSEFEIEIATELIKDKLIRLCDGKNCNSFSSVPQPQKCSSCNSDLDPRCATNPNLVGNTIDCTTVPYTECHSHVNSDGHTLRGCLSSLDRETFYNCLTNPDDKRCAICKGDKCNEIDVFPSDRLRCHQCSSTTDPTCGVSPSSNAVCPLYKETDTCVTNLRNGVTTRGCSSTMKCDNADDSRNCRVCTSSGCNTIDLTKISEDGEPGRWTPIPLTCYTCDENDEEGDCAEVSRLRPCLNNPYQNCMTVFDAEGKVIQRGCSDTLEADKGDYCNNNAGKCPRCNSPGCNVARDLDQYVECISCDTDTNGNCVVDVDAITKTRRCYQHCMTAMYVRDEEDNPAYGLSRSCLDDMGWTDQEACQAGENEYCKVCNTASCNKEEIPTQRLSCYHCKDDNCQDPQMQSCVNYRPLDKCYIQLDEKVGIIAMGCRSEFTNNEADYLVKEKRLFTCDEDNCNEIDALPTPRACALCNSRTDVKCAVAPENMGFTTCAVVPYTQCYSRVLPDGMTERGCLSNLQDDDFLSCLNGTSTTCEMCDSSHCNKKIFPSDRATCHTCDSSADPNCEAEPNSLNVCPKYDVDETCVTQFRNGITYRGCSSSISCDITNPKSCRKCAGNGCNVVNLARRQDDNFGKWQDLPLRCWTCEGEACQSVETTEAVTCANNNEQDCVVVFDEGGNVIRRGCSDEVEVALGEYCDASEENCYNCKSNECNSASSRADFVDCVYCDSYKDLNCIWNPLSSSHGTRKCAGGCMTALYPSDSNSNPSYDLIRTCLSDKEAADQSTCAGDCKSCTGTGCNVEDLPEGRLTCYSCNGDECQDPALRQCPLYKEDDKCFIWFDEQNSVSSMGCISSFRNQELEDIIKTKRVFVCDGKDCNSFDNIPMPQKCAVCNSNNDVACATDALEVGTFNTCSQQPYTSCYSKLASDGSTVRGCLYDLPADDFVACLLGNDEKCGACQGDGCNREIFPADRLQCYTCTSNDDESCESFPTRQRACPRVVDSESCVSAFGLNVTVRGCSSQIFCDSNDRGTCRACRGTSCNTIDLRNKIDDGYHGIWQTLPLRCHTCEGDHCKISLGPYVTCDENYEEDCMTVFDENGDVKRRGCSDDVETYEDQYCRKNPAHCYRCKSNECNVAWSLDEYVSCAFCNSSSNALCVTNPEYADFATRSCYKECMVALKEEEVVRSCLDDKEILVQHVCRTDASGKECATCENNNCNKFNYPTDRLKCHICSGSSCTNSEAQYCEKYDENDYCFAKWERGQIDVIGCASSQNASDIAQWIEQRVFYRCDGNECNELNKLPKSADCLVCNSDTTPQCAQNPTQVTTTEICSAPYGECLTYIDEFGATMRTCASKLPDEEVASCLATGTCDVCSDNKCNSKIFPANRRRCHICNSISQEDCKAEYCEKYDENDYCFAKYENGEVDVIGCASSQNASDIAQWIEQQKFYRCDGDECNDLSKLPRTGECLSCDSSKTPACAQNPGQVTTTESCAPRSECFTRIEGGNTLRGCANSLTNDEETICVGAGLCAICSESKCNSEIFPISRRKCYICNSVAEEDCKSGGQNALVCPNYTPNDSCVAYKDADDYVRRGCASDFTCDANEENCEVCSTDLCNTADLSAAGFVTGSLALTLILAFVAIFTLNN